MVFVFQGNPNKFDIDNYLARYPYIYWSVPVLHNEIRIGDQIVIWCAGDFAGAIALGRKTEASKVSM